MNAVEATRERCVCPYCKHAWEATIYVRVKREHVCPECGGTMDIWMPEITPLERQARLFITKYGCSLSLEGEAVPLVKALLARIHQLEDEE